MIEIIEEAHLRDFDIVAFNYRGLAGCPLLTPRFYTPASIEDILEPMHYFFDKYCKSQGKKAMAIGLSMGGNLLANAMGAEGGATILTAACSIGAPIKMNEVAATLREALNGTYDKKLASYMIEYVRKHEEIMSEHFQEQHQMDIMKALDEGVVTTYDFEYIFTIKLYGYDSVE